MATTRRTWVLCLLMLAGGAGRPAPAGQDESGKSKVAETTNKPASFRVPAGFVLERVAGPPLVERPMLAAFDDEGNLYVCDSAGVNARGNELAKTLPHCIRKLTDSDGDGVFDRSTVFADKLVFPQGVCWHDGWLYVSSPPDFWRMTDSDGDGVADEREVLATGFANTGVADDMHGATVGPDGRIYWCAGRFPHELRRPKGPVIHKGTAPLILRCKPDGSEFEVFSGAQGNAVGVAFNSRGDAFASGTYLAPPAMGPTLRDAVIHCIDGGEYPVRDRILNEHKRTGDLLPPLAHLGFAAASDLEIYRHPEFGADFFENLFVACFNTHRVLRLRLEKDGATYRTTPEDFLVSSDPDFHPTDVLADADGSLLVVDTGGWFRIGCPTSQLAKPEIKGGIYRIRRTGAERPADPRGLKLAWTSMKTADLIALLASDRPEIADRAMTQLARGRYETVEALGDAALDAGKPEPQRLRAIWTLARMFDYQARDEINQCLLKYDGALFEAAARGAGLWRDRAALAALVRRLDDTADPACAREAANALGRIRDRVAVPALLRRLRQPADRFLEHALIFAMIRIGHAPSVREGLKDVFPAVRRAALIALDQMEKGGLAAEEVGALLGAPEAPVREGARWVAARHPEWGERLLPFFEAIRSVGEISAERREELLPLLAVFCGNADFQRMAAERLTAASTPAAERTALFGAMASAPIDRTPFRWKEALARCLESEDDAVVASAVSTLLSLPAEPAPAHVRIDPQVNFPPPGGPKIGTALKGDFTVRWTGVLRINDGGRHTFVLNSEDGSRLWIDGKVVVDNGGFHGLKESRGLVFLEAGDREIAVDYFVRGTGGACVLSVIDGEGERVVPAEWLFHREAGAPGSGEGPLKPGLRAEFFAMRPPDGKFIDLRPVDLRTGLLRASRNERLPARTRIDALAALRNGADPMEATSFRFLLASLQDSDPLTRLAAAEVLAAARLEAEWFGELLPAVRRAGVLELGRLLAAWEHGGDEATGKALLAALGDSPGLGGIRAQELDRALRRFPESVREAAKPLLEKLRVDASAQKARLEELKPLLEGGDAARGKALFEGKKAMCSSCHLVNGAGGRIGPDLSRIAAMRSPADLLEAVAFPSLSFARGYEPFTLETTDGAVLSGIIARESAEAITLYDANRNERRIPRSGIAQIRRSEVSIMPQGLDQQLTNDELRDVLAYLQSLK